MPAIRFDYAFVDTIDSKGKILLTHPTKSRDLKIDAFPTETTALNEWLKKGNFGTQKDKSHVSKLLNAVALAHALNVEELRTRKGGLIVRLFLGKNAYPNLEKSLAKISASPLRQGASNGWAFFISPEEKIYLIENGRFRGPELSPELSKLILEISKLSRGETQAKVLVRQPKPISAQPPPPPISIISKEAKPLLKAEPKELEFEERAASPPKLMAKPRTAFRRNVTPPPKLMAKPPTATRRIITPTLKLKAKPQTETRRIVTPPPKLMAKPPTAPRRIVTPTLKLRAKPPTPLGPLVIPIPMLRAKPRTVPRWIQGKVNRSISDSKSVPAETAFYAGSKYLLTVRIGPADSEWLTPTKGPSIPEDKVTYKKGKADLQVVFNEPNHAPKPQTANVTLPKIGPSTICQFRFQIKRKSPTFSGRIVVLQKNRIIQTALLKGEVVSDPNQAPKSPMEITIESLIRKDLTDLNSRQKYDVALIANHTENGEPTLTAIAGIKAMFSSIKNMEPTINKITENLEKISVDPSIYPIDIFSPKITSWIRDLSLQGRDLYEGIIVDSHLEDQTEKASCIQLLSKRPDYLPLEFLYDGSPPDLNAPLCPQTKQALEKGECPGCKVKEDVPAKYICPLGFWLLRMIIERHLIQDPDFEKKEGEYEMEFEPVSDRNKLQILKSALFAASTKVDEATPGNSAQLFSILQQATNGQTTQANSWDEWASEIQAKDPSLLVIITHTSEGGPKHNMDQMEIGDGSNMFRQYITKKQIKGSENSKPVLLLLGCDTGVSRQPLGGRGSAVVDVSFQTYAAKFAREGAVIVVSTLTKILGRHAVPVAKTLIEALKQSAQEGKSLGDTLLQTRKKYFAEGIPMALTLIANGDADWRFTQTGA